MKRILKVFPFFIVVVLFLSTIGCQHDDTARQDEELETQFKRLDLVGHVVQGDSIRQINKDLDLFLNTRFEQRDRFSNEDITSNSYGFTVLTDRLMQLSSDTYTNYIFNITRDNPTLDGFENYMLTAFNDGRYMQVLIYYPFIESENGLVADINNATVTYINDISLLTGIETSPCPSASAEIIAWEEECVAVLCGEGKNHYPGEACDNGEYVAHWNCTGGWVVTGCVYTGGGGSSSPNDPFPPTGNGGNPTNPVEPNNPDEEVPTVPFIPAWQRVVNCVNDGAMGSFDNSLPLSGEDISWLQSQLGSVNANNMSDFIDANGCEESDSFIDEAVELVRLGGKFDKENNVILDPSFVGTRAECAYNKIKSTNGTLYKKTIDLFTNDPKYKLILTVGNCLNTDVACTDGSEVDTTGIIKIIIEDLGEPTLELISTLLHEAIHAEIFRYVSARQSGVDPNDRPRLLQLYQYYKGLVNNPNYTGDPVTDAQHTYMAEKYVKPIAQAIREIDGNNYPLEHYMWYGWEGLENYDFQNKLTPALRQQYNQYQTIINGSTSVNCN